MREQLPARPPEGDVAQRQGDTAQRAGGWVQMFPWSRDQPSRHRTHQAGAAASSLHPEGAVCGLEPHWGGPAGPGNIYGRGAGFDQKSKTPATQGTRYRSPPKRQAYQRKGRTGPQPTRAGTAQKITRPQRWNAPQNQPSAREGPVMQSGAVFVPGQIKPYPAPAARPPEEAGGRRRM